MGSATKRKKSPVTVRGAWLPLSVEVLRSRVFSELSPLAAKMLLALCAQLGYNAKGNGDISAAPAILEPLGWTSKASVAAALAELVRVGLLCITRRGSRGRCSLYAVTLWPMDCDFSKLDHGPGCYDVEGWRDDSAKRDPPTSDRPAKWNRSRKNAMAPPATGNAEANLPPLRGKVRRDGAALTPATGANAPHFGPKVPPPRDTYLDKPSVIVAMKAIVVHKTSLPRMGQVIAHRIACRVPRPIAYEDARWDFQLTLPHRATKEALA